MAEPPEDPAILQYLPHRPPFLFVDKVVERQEDSLTSELKVRPDFDFFRGHYPDFPLMPGVLVCEACFQSAAILLAGKDHGGHGGGVPVLTRIDNARFRSPVKPGDTLTIKVSIRERQGKFYFMEGRVSKGKEKVCQLSFVLTEAEIS